MSFIIVDEKIPDFEQFYGHSVKNNSETANYAIKYDNNTDEELLYSYYFDGQPLNIIINNFAIVYSSDIYSTNRNFKIPFFEDLSGTNSTRRFFSNRLETLLYNIDIKLSQPWYFDIITSNLTDPSFAEEVIAIQNTLTNCTIRYSTRIMGHSPYGYWTVDNGDIPNAIDIKSTYFNTQEIDRWTNILARGINLESLALKNPSAFTYNLSTCKLRKNINISDISLNGTQKINDNYFYIEICNGEIFDGSGYAIDVSFNNLGLFNSYDVTDFNSAPLIKNVKVNSLTGITGNVNFQSRVSGGGGIVRAFQKYIKVNNCQSEGNILDIANNNLQPGLGSGGICGSFGCWKGGKIFIENCSHSGNIGKNGGGIAGAGLGAYSGQCVVYNCSSSGSISENAGGICGAGLCVSLGQTIVENCYSTGSIGIGAGGICGASCGTQEAKNTYMSYCYSTGNIDSSGGGICGSYAGQDGNCYVDHCYSTGDISENAGGIYGTSAAGITANRYIVADTCYSTGKIGNNSGGIIGPKSCYNGTILANNCYSSGTIGTNAGGIFGYDTGNSNGKAYVFNSFCNNGKIAGSINCPLYINRIDLSANADTSCNLLPITGGINTDLLASNDVSLNMLDNNIYNVTQWTADDWVPGTSSGGVQRLLTFIANTATSTLTLDPNLFVGLNDTERNNVRRLFFDKFFNTPIRDESEIKPVNWFSDASNLGFTDTSGDLIYKIYNSASQTLDLSTLDLSNAVYVSQFSTGVSYNLDFGDVTYSIARVGDTSYRFTDTNGAISDIINVGETVVINGYSITFGSIKVHKYIKPNDKILTFILISRVPSIDIFKIRENNKENALLIAWKKVTGALFYKIYKITREKVVLLETIISRNDKIEYLDKTTSKLQKNIKYKIEAYSRNNKLIAENIISV
jgi:hypothetical protein